MNEHHITLAIREIRRLVKRYHKWQGFQKKFNEHSLRKETRIDQKLWDKFTYYDCRNKGKPNEREFMKGWESYWSVINCDQRLSWIRPFEKPIDNMIFWKTYYVLVEVPLFNESRPRWYHRSVVTPDIGVQRSWILRFSLLVAGTIIVWNRTWPQKDLTTCALYLLCEHGSHLYSAIQ